MSDYFSTLDMTSQPMLLPWTSCAVESTVLTLNMYAEYPQTDPTVRVTPWPAEIIGLIHHWFV